MNNNIQSIWHDCLIRGLPYHLKKNVMKKGLMILAIAVSFGLINLQSMMAMNMVPDTALVADKDVKYEEIKTTELPATINESVQNSYAEFTIVKAYLGGDGTYKVKLKKDDKYKIVYYSADGKLKEAQESKQEMNTDQPK